MAASTMTLEEMRCIVEQADEVDYWKWEVRQRELQSELRAKANAVVAALREQLPPQILQDLLDVSEAPAGAEYLAQALHPDNDCHRDGLPF